MSFKNTNLEVTNNLLRLLDQGDWQTHKLDEALVQSLLRDLLYNLIFPPDAKTINPVEERVEVVLRTVFNEVEVIDSNGMNHGLPQYVLDIIKSYEPEKG